MAFAHEMKGYAEKKPLNFCCPLCFFEDNSEKKFSAHYEKCLILWTKNNKEKMNQEPKPEVRKVSTTEDGVWLQGAEVHCVTSRNHPSPFLP